MSTAATVPTIRVLQPSRYSTDGGFASEVGTSFRKLLGHQRRGPINRPVFNRRQALGALFVQHGPESHHDEENKGHLCEGKRIVGRHSNPERQNRRRYRGEEPSLCRVIALGQLTCSPHEPPEYPQ